MRYSFHGGIFSPVNVSLADATRLHSVFIPGNIIVSTGEYYTACVSVGDKVNAGDVVARSEDASLMPCLAPIAGEVTEICDRKIYIEGGNEEGGQEAHFTKIESFESISTPLSQTPPELLCEIMRRGAVASPSCPLGAHSVCNSVRGFEGTRRVIIDCTCAEDGFSTVRYILGARSEELIGGVKILIRACSAIGAVLIADEASIPAIRVLERLIDGKLTVLRVTEAKYPISDKKLLMHATIGKECPPDKAPADFGCAIFDAEACVGVYEAVTKGLPMLRRLISVRSKKDLRTVSVPVGTRVLDITDAFYDGAQAVSFGAFLPVFGRGELCDRVISRSEKSVIPKGTKKRAHSLPCTKCMKCDSVCPMYLSPYRLLRANGDEKKLGALGISSCIRCNCCSAVCPSEIDIPFHFSSKASESESLLHDDDSNRDVSDEAVTEVSGSGGTYVGADEVPDECTSKGNGTEEGSRNEEAE